MRLPFKNKTTPGPYFGTIYTSSMHVKLPQYTSKPLGLLSNNRHAGSHGMTTAFQWCGLWNCFEYPLLTSNGSWTNCATTWHRMNSGEANHYLLRPKLRWVSTDSRMDQHMLQLATAFSRALWRPFNANSATCWAALSALHRALCFGAGLATARVSCVLVLLWTRTMLGSVEAPRGERPTLSGTIGVPRLAARG
jgi:hypothetical protein